MKVAKIKCNLSVVLASTILHHGVGVAQVADSGSSAANSSSQLSDIIVTAQKREESLQSVPLAVTALTADTVERARINNVTNLTALVPNMTTTVASAGNGIPSITIRGLNGTSGILGADNPVSIYVDGVYQGDYFGAIQDVAVIDRVEVLRGPQGTLFGRNSTGGAISFVTAPPLGRFALRQQLTLGNYAQRRFKTSLDLPEFGGISIALTYLHDEQRGDVRNLGAGTVFDFLPSTNGQVGRLRASKRLNGHNTDALHASARLELVENLQLDYRFDWLDTHSEPDARQVLGFSAGPGGALAEAILAAQPDGYASLISLKRLGAVNSALSQSNHIRGINNSLTAQWNVSDTVSIKDIIAYRVLKLGPKSNQIDGAGGLVITPEINYLCPTTRPDCEGDPFILLAIGAQRRTNYQFSNELQMNVDSDQVDLVAGYFYYNQLTKETPPPLTVSFQTAPGFVYPGRLAGNSEAKIHSNALFLQATWHLADSIDATGGVRTTWDKKRIVEFGRLYPVFTNNRFDYLANIAWTIRPDVLAYAKVSTGYQSGGVTNGFAYDPESVTAYELGLKGDFLERRLRFNAAGFYTDYKNLQFATFDVVDGSRTRNAGRARIWGLEIETTAIPAAGLTLNGNIGYTNFKYRRLDPRVGVVGSYFPTNRPKVTGNVAANYTFPQQSWGALSFDADVQYRGSMNLVARNNLPDPALRHALFNNAQWLVNLRATVSDVDLGRSTAGKVSAWIRNLTNDKTLVNALDLSSVAVGAFQRPRTYGLDFEVSF